MSNRGRPISSGTGAATRRTPALLRNLGCPPKRPLPWKLRRRMRFPRRAPSAPVQAPASDAQSHRRRRSVPSHRLGPVSLPRMGDFVSRTTAHGMAVVFGPCSHRAGQSVVLSASGEARFHSYRGKSGLVSRRPVHSGCRRSGRACSPVLTGGGLPRWCCPALPIGRGPGQAYRRRGLLQSAVHHQVPWPPNLDPAELPDARGGRRDP